MPIPAIVIQIALAIVASVVSAYLAVQNIPDAQAATGKAPESKDGTTIRKVYGTVWIDDSQVCAYKDLPPEPIRKKAGKK